MPIQHTMLEPEDVMRVLKMRGYGFHADRNAAITLTRPDMEKPRFRMTGAPRRVVLNPVSHRDYGKIMRESADAVEAADRIEAISLGKPQPSSQERGEAATVPDIEQMVAARIDAAIERATSAMAEQMADRNQEIAAQKKQIEMLQAELAKRTAKKPAPKAKPKPKSKRASPVVEAAREQVQAESESAAPTQSRDDDLPDLTDEQAAMLNQVKFGPRHG